MQVDYLIVGQGICGTMLSWYLHKEGKSFLVMDEEKPNSSSKVAAGVMNPVTGRRYTYSWKIEDILPFTVQAYEHLGQYLGHRIVYKRSVIDFFPSPQARISFIEKLAENDTYLHAYPDQNHFNQYFHYDFGCGEISPAYTVHLQLLLNAWRKQLAADQRMINAAFQAEQLQVRASAIQYQDIQAEKIIFCEGTYGSANPWFRLLPFAANKGEALIIHCEDLTNEHIYKKGMLLVPLPEENTYWLGSNYQWEFADESPTPAFYEQGNTLLKNWLKKPFSIIEHRAAVRPATIERRPFVGFHPLFRNIGILNGMGTKGTSLAPFFAHQMAQHLIYDFPITPEADVQRFTRILSK